MMACLFVMPSAESVPIFAMSFLNCAIRLRSIVTFEVTGLVALAGVGRVSLVSMGDVLMFMAFPFYAVPFNYGYLSEKR
ncbi:MAG: hypothetical protein CVT70_17985 [Alphaproteobacteria bacterium HGW-Alphaproteobacteria-1]|nr:MAG: hypothetical protein CVT70_17985 [Alphaproteobacteria bacterium HGW-Alphaproteobacteria-1]